MKWQYLVTRTSACANWLLCLNAQKLYRHEALSVHKPGSSIAEDLPIICHEVLSTHETEAICHGYFCHIKRATLLYMRAMFVVDDLTF
jgi:hypothetical protein